MSFLKAFLMVLAMVFMFNLGGCCGGGSETKVISAPATPTTTLGQELQDLDEAFQKGAITKEEYENAKNKLLKQRTEENK